MDIVFILLIGLISSASYTFNLVFNNYKLRREVIQLKDKIKHQEYMHHFRQELLFASWRDLNAANKGARRLSKKVKRLKNKDLVYFSPELDVALNNALRDSATKIIKGRKVE